jgi:hypothetical protein
MYQRKTTDEFEIQGNYGHGWECETAEATLKEAKAQAKCYRENVNYPIRIIKKRIKIESEVKA